MEALKNTTDLTSDKLENLYLSMQPPLDELGVDENYAEQLAATQYIWQKGGYRCGITAHIIFFLMSPGFVTKSAEVRPNRFGKMLNFGKSFDFADTFIKKVTASGHGQQYELGIADENVQKFLKSIQRAHDELDIDHREMVHFGYRLMQQLEDDIGDLTPSHKQLHLQYFNKAYRIMGIPFSDDRQLLEEFCLELEKRYANFNQGLSPPYCQKLLFIGLTVGVPCDRESLARLLPAYTKPIFEKHYTELKPGIAWLLLGRFLNILLYPRRRYKNPRPTTQPDW